MKKKFLHGLEALLFVIIFLFLFQRISLIVQVYGTEDYDPDRRSCLFFSLPNDSVDVLFAGTSHVYCSYIPQKIYEETGISSACLSTSSQSYQNTYWLLKQALTKQSPKVVVVDIHSILTAVDENVKGFRLHYTSGISALPDLSPLKIMAYKDIKNSGYGWSNNMTLFDSYGILEYKNEHSREGDGIAEMLNILMNPANEFQTFGFYPTTTITPMETVYPGITTDKFVDFYKTFEYEYLNKIYQMLQKKGIELVLARAPYNIGDFDDNQLYSQAFDWAKKNEIPVVDYFELIDETGISLDTDFRDGDHLNYWGAQKSTTYMQNYLKENYSLADHRGDSKYDLWEKNTFDYTAMENELNNRLAQMQAK